MIGPHHHIYDIQESSLVLSEVVEPEDLTFADEVDIDGWWRHLCARGSLQMTQTTKNTRGVREMRELQPTHLYRRTVKKNISFPPHFSRMLIRDRFKLFLDLNSTDTLG